MEPRLLLPLLALLSLQGVALLNLVPLLRGTARVALAPVSASTLAVGVGWALLNALLLLAALRCCRDRPRASATPWLAWGEAVHVNGTPAVLSAISEDGVELQLPREAPWPGGPELELRCSDGRMWPLRLEAVAGLQLGCRWGPLDGDQRQQLQQRLYQRDGQWPTRRAPAEPLALAVTLLRLVWPLPAETWFQRSLLPVRPPGGPAEASSNPFMRVVSYQ